MTLRESAEAIGVRPTTSSRLGPRLAPALFPTGLPSGIGTPCICQADRPFGVGTPGIRQTERTVGAASYRVSVFVILPVVLPAAGEANLELTSPLKRRVPTAGTRVRFATRFSHYRSLVHRLDVLLKPPGTAREFFRRRPLLLTGMLVHHLHLPLLIQFKSRAQSHPSHSSVASI